MLSHMLARVLGLGWIVGKPGLSVPYRGKITRFRNLSGDFLHRTSVPLRNGPAMVTGLLVPSGTR